MWLALRGASIAPTRSPAGRRANPGLSCSPWEFGAPRWWAGRGVRRADGRRRGMRVAAGAAGVAGGAVAAAACGTCVDFGGTAVAGPVRGVRRSGRRGSGGHPGAGRTGVFPGRGGCRRAGRVVFGARGAGGRARDAGAARGAPAGRPGSIVAGQGAGPGTPAVAGGSWSGCWVGHRAHGITRRAGAGGQVSSGGRGWAAGWKSVARAPLSAPLMALIIDECAWMARFLNGW